MGPRGSPGSPRAPAVAEKTFGFEGPKSSYELGSGVFFIILKCPGDLLGDLLDQFWISFWCSRGPTDYLEAFLNEIWKIWKFQFFQFFQLFLDVMVRPFLEHRALAEAHLFRISSFFNDAWNVRLSSKLKPETSGRKTIPEGVQSTLLSLKTYLASF